MQVPLTIVLVFVSRTVAQVCKYDDSVELTNRTYNNIEYKNGEYFVDNATQSERGCVCFKEICIRKCCEFDEAYDTDLNQCVSYSGDFNPPVLRGFNVDPKFNALKEFHVWPMGIFINCSTTDEAMLVSSHTTQDYHLKTDGILYLTIEDNIPSKTSYGSDKFCIDNFLSGDTSPKTVKYDALICFKYKEQENHYALNSSCMVVSCFFILLTVVVYAILPELRNLHGMVMTTYLMCFFVAFLFLAIMDIMLLMKNIYQPTCTALTFVIYFAWLSAFFWLNVMCYDLWAKFRITNMVHGFQESTRIRYLKYCAYAFGIPTALTILLATLEFSVPQTRSKLLPRLRMQGCFINGYGKLLYLYTPIIIICISNMILFILTAKKIAKTKEQTKMLNKKDSQRLELYIKLFIVTGINWIWEVTSAIYPDIPYLWQITDVYNILVGFVIFVIFVCKKDKWVSIKENIFRIKSQV